jgi:hypothetical protein
MFYRTLYMIVEKKESILGKKKDKYTFKSGAIPIKVQEHDKEFFDQIEDEHYKMHKKYIYKRFGVGRLLVLIILGIAYYPLAILYFLYSLMPRVAQSHARANAIAIFIKEKIHPIPLYSSTEGLKVIKNLGFMIADKSDSDHIKEEAQIKAYNAGANAIINVGNSTVASSSVISDMIGNGVHTNISYDDTISGDLAVIE